MSTSTTLEGAPGSYLRDQQLQQGLQFPIELTCAQFLDAVTQKSLIPDTLYKITDKGDAGYFLRSITNEFIAIHGTGLFLTPRYYGTGTFEGNNWIGIWDAEKSVQVGDLAVWPNHGALTADLQIQDDLVWRNKTGAIGTSDADTLDAVNWELVPRTLTSPLYFLQLFRVEVGGATRPGLNDI
jgi:hypothetical protein